VPCNCSLQVVMGPAPRGPRSHRACSEHGPRDRPVRTLPRLHRARTPGHAVDPAHARCV